MFSIKSSFANCMNCPLLESNSCILETNSKTDLSKVEIVFVAENPGYEEIDKERPLVGRSGEMFRTYFKLFNLNKLKYLLTNVVLCQTINPDKTTGNPTNETINICKENCFNIINYCNPKLIVLMGTTPMKAFEIAESGITNLRGQLYKWNNFDILLTVHPSFVNRNKSFESKFASDFQKASEIMGSSSGKKINTHIGTYLQKGIFRYSIPEKFYEENYRLVDIQSLVQERKVLYIFRDQNNKKIYHKENDDYYCYQIPKDSNVEARYLVDYNDLIQLKLPYKQKVLLDPDITYEGDSKITVKHAQDYYYNSKGEPDPTNLNIMYFDIETYSEKRGFPNPIDASHIIAMVSYSFQNKLVTYVIDNKILLKNPKAEDIIESIDSEIIICKSERELITNYIRDIKKLKVDIITGWNINNFDIPYIYNRSFKIGINPNTLSEFGDVSVDPGRNYIDINGIVLLDQYILYKNFVPTGRENYKLDTIGMIELGMKKLGEGGNFSEMYRNDINKSIQYNIRDVQITVGLEKKLRHITLQDEIKRVSNSSFRGSSGNMGMLDSLMVSTMKNKGLASKNADVHKKAESFPGAYVKEPIVGLHDWIVDFDFTSLYPSIIMTYNIGVNTFVMKFKDHQLGYNFTYDFESLPDKVIIIMDPLFSKEEIEMTKQDLFDKVKKENLIYTINGCFYKNHNDEKSFYSEILSPLLSSRKEYKSKMFKAKEEGQKDLSSMYNTRQLVYKIFANALYGVLGNKVFRYFSVDMSKSITLSGQESIKTAIIEADSFIDSYNTKVHTKPIKLTKDEMFGDLYRNNEYIITGDTDSLFSELNKVNEIEKTTGDQKLEVINKYCTEIQEYLNKSIEEMVIQKHNVSSEFNMLFLKNELIIKRGIFVSKKHYAINIISQEGVLSNEVVSMGLETKRSDFSTDTKNSLNELLDLLLKTEKVSLSKINQFIERKKMEFIKKIKRGEKSIAKPAAYTKKLKDYKVVPQNVRGCIAWNELVYKAFVVGDKGYLFKLKGINLDIAPDNIVKSYNKYLEKGKKLDVICLPNEEMTLPKYFIIDSKAMYEFAWEKRYNQLLESVASINVRIQTI